MSGNVTSTSTTITLTSDESSIIVESTSPAQQVKVNETNQKLVTSQDKEVVPEKNLSQENNYDPQISESDVNDGGVYNCCHWSPVTNNWDAKLRSCASFQDGECSVNSANN
jgi:DUF971 family protein